MVLTILIALFIIGTFTGLLSSVLFEKKLSFGIISLSFILGGLLSLFMPILIIISLITIYYESMD